MSEAGKEGGSLRPPAPGEERLGDRDAVRGPGDSLTQAQSIVELDRVGRLVPKESVPGASHERRKTHWRLPYWRLQRILKARE